MKSEALQTFEHVIKDSLDLLKQFDDLNKNASAALEAEVLKRASLVMALAALETYVEDRVAEGVHSIVGHGSEESILVRFYKSSLESDLKYFHTPNTNRVRDIFEKYLGVDVTEGWIWNNYDQKRACTELNKIAKKRGDIAHRSSRPAAGVPTAHAVTREDLRKHIRFIIDLVEATDAFLGKTLN